MPDDGSDSDYEHLQQVLLRIAPNIGDTAWGHKYLSLLYPEKLDDFHNPKYAKFHLIKLLQLTPQSEGRYTAASRYVTLAHALEMPLPILTTLLKNLVQLRPSLKNELVSDNNKLIVVIPSR